ncbi:hypothetical protein F2P47_17210 [Parvibaculum sedimenti]|uniref:Uncharacterized protein n=1 Tax=Parvibaculum sedimenti TaxID=2608632 RepID=A0A6N6VCK1_9HYPH|nr:hypothetical protein [Parvibaculum sedimenti]KAB7738445.1 hypothetical protein F2P47_17210 [Parvibaculum sedimenti]
MALAIETFKNADLAHGWRPGNNAGGATLFKALGHPLTAPKAHALIEDLAKAGPVAIYDPTNAIGNFHAYYDLSRLEVAGYYVQRVEDLSAAFLGHDAKPVSEIAASDAKAVLVLLFDADRVLAPMRHVLPAGARIATLDEMRLPDDMLTNRSNYLDPMNFATNFALMREADGIHTRVGSANYWSLHGAENPELWLCLFGEDGEELAEWREPLPAPGAPFAIDSAEVRHRFGLGDFTGSLFIHAIRIKGHDVVKYALDMYGEDGRALSCSHDANAWPADYYAGMPAGEEDESVTLFIQNSHPMPIPPRSIGLNIMGAQDVSWFEDEIAPFATCAISVDDLLPQARWPDQVEIVAGRYFVRPRYEVKRAQGQRRIAHANVERTDLKPNPALASLGKVMGKGYIMPLPVLPRDEFNSVMLPTPMATGQSELPIRAELIDASGALVASRYLGRIQRRDSVEIDVEGWIADEALKLPSGYGHVEFLYDFRDGGEGDGWLHALGRFEQKSSGHRAETIFGAHIYNTAVIYKDEPQSYTNKPPGLTTRLFLRLGSDGLDTICHLIYPASTPWHAKSSTLLILHDAEGKPIAEKPIEIACGGSRFWRLSEMFSKEEREAMGGAGYVIVRDTTCRLFGFHGLTNGAKSFCLDHMFGF